MFCLKKIDKRFVQLSLSFACLLAVSCNEKPAQTFLFNIDSLVSRQEEYLVTANARVHKHAVINGVADDTVLQDKTIWKKELEIFRQLNAINKPVNKTNYLVDDGLFDPSSNLTVKAFSAKTDLPVQYVRVFYDESIARPRKIEALYRNANVLYANTRVLTMEFENLNNEIVLTSYSILGGQKMMLGDSVMFTIDAEITIN
jgi:hypothetical protein